MCHIYNDDVKLNITSRPEEINQNYPKFFGILQWAFINQLHIPYFYYSDGLVYVYVCAADPILLDNMRFSQFQTAFKDLILLLKSLFKYLGDLFLKK